MFQYFHYLLENLQNADSISISNCAIHMYMKRPELTKIT